MVRLRQLQRSFFLTLLSLLPTALAASTTLNMSWPGCPDKCGNITIPYPFGTRDGCYRDGFDVTCNKSTNPPKLFMGSQPPNNTEIIDINITTGEARVIQTNFSYVCYNQSNNISDHRDAQLNFEHYPAFLFSNQRNKFTVIGCDTIAYIVAEDNRNGSYWSGCVSHCDSQIKTTGDGGICNGMGCCQTAIPAELNYYEVQWDSNSNYGWEFNPCNYAMLVEDDWYKFQVQDLSGHNFYNSHKNGLPFVLDWAIRDSGTCQDGVEQSTKPACLSIHSTCSNTSNGKGYLCQCKPGYEGNPYLLGGCIDIDECKKNPCSGICKNIDGNFTCSCPKGFFTHGNPQVGQDASCNTDTARVISLIIVLGFGTGCIAFLLYFFIRKRLKLFEKRKQQKLKEKFFNQNHGFLLQQRIASDEDATQRMRIFTLDELDKATNRFDNALILGQGGHGVVYKGILSDQRIVAIKRSKIVDQVEINQFINEMVILSQVNHRNVVKLYGCCLETEVPLLVYEFISNGTLFYHLHAEPYSLTWTHRLRIALGAARAIAYLHSSASISVFHRDIKSSNILLDDYFTSKVSDFGASRSVQLDQTGITTGIQGTFGYLDPEYYYTGRLTPKSDVYSFGVILVELLTREKPYLMLFEGGGLVSYFTSAVKEKRLFEILDPQVAVNKGQRTEIEAIANLAEICVRMKGEERPTMKEVEVRLDILWQSNQHRKHPCGYQNLEKIPLPFHESTAGNDTSTTRQYSFEQELLSSSNFPR